MSENIFFKADNICGGYGKKEIIHNVSFELKTNTLTAVIGGNGCGKTTLIKCIANQLAHKGNCTLQGEMLENLNNRRLAQKISYIPQKSGISISLPVSEIVLMGFNPVLKLLEQPDKKHRKAAHEALCAVGMAEYENEDFLTLSEGQKQLVFLARTIAENSPLLLLDEPDSALDFQNRYQILKLLEKMVSEGERAGLLCLHDPSLALEFCQQLILMKDGKCIKVIDTEKDSVEYMEEALKEIYGSVSLAEVTGRNGGKHLVLLWEENI